MVGHAAGPPEENIVRRRILVLLLALAHPALAQTPTRAVMAEHASHRYPQQVRVGDLPGRNLLAPEESQPILGHVVAITRQPGGIDVLIRTGATLGFGGRTVAVPIEAVALLGEHMALMELTPAQLAALPATDAAAETPLPPDERIRVALVKPFH